MVLFTVVVFGTKELRVTFPLEQQAILYFGERKHPRGAKGMFPAELACALMG